MEAHPLGKQRPRRRQQGPVGTIIVLCCTFFVFTASSLSSSSSIAQARASTPNAADILQANQSPFGSNVYIFAPGMGQDQIQTTVDRIGGQQTSNEFGQQRYALLFEPGTYGTANHPLIFQVGYYTMVAGLGLSPNDVVINGAVNVYNQCFGGSNCVALINFWRSMSNLTINVTGSDGCHHDETWAVSQAAPLRRVHIKGTTTLTDTCTNPSYASGGFIADSEFDGGAVNNGAQQQWFIRNSKIAGWSNGTWNQVFSGVVGAPTPCFSTPDGCSGPYMTLTSSPVTREAPYLYTGAGGTYSIYRPALQHTSSGTSWKHGKTAGITIPIKKFFIARPADSAATINAALATGKNLILTPGIYQLDRSIMVTHPDTVVLGLGFPTLIPRHGATSMILTSTRGVALSGMIFDAGPTRSPMLLQVGTSQKHQQKADRDPTTIQDVFFRVGGPAAGSATDSLVVNGDNVILDDIWAWRADHGNGVGWNSNMGDTGLLVNGDHVTAYGLAVEHYQKYEVIWNGNDGTDVFFQNEMPYDPPSQDAWMEAPGVNGWAAFKIANTVTSFHGYGMGSYSFFDQGVDIRAAHAFEVPTTLLTPGLYHLFTIFLSGSGGIENVVNNRGGPSTVDHADAPTSLARI